MTSIENSQSYVIEMINENDLHVRSQVVVDFTRFILNVKKAYIVTWSEDCQYSKHVVCNMKSFVYHHRRWILFYQIRTKLKMLYVDDNELGLVVNAYVDNKSLITLCKDKIPLKHVPIEVVPDSKTWMKLTVYNLTMMNNGVHVTAIVDDQQLFEKFYNVQQCVLLEYCDDEQSVLRGKWTQRFVENSSNFRCFGNKWFLFLMFNRPDISPCVFYITDRDEVNNERYATNDRLIEICKPLIPLDQIPLVVTIDKSLWPYNLNSNLTKSESSACSNEQEKSDSSACSNEQEKSESSACSNEQTSKEKQSIFKYSSFFIFVVVPLFLYSRFIINREISSNSVNVMDQMFWVCAPMISSSCFLTNEACAPSQFIDAFSNVKGNITSEIAHLISNEDQVLFNTKTDWDRLLFRTLSGKRYVHIPKSLVTSGTITIKHIKVADWNTEFWKCPITWLIT